MGALVRRGPSPAYVEFSAGPAAVSAIVTEDLADGSTLVAGDRCTSSVPKLWHLPGGTTREGRQSTLRLFNPFPDQAKVTVTGTSEFGEVGLVDLAAVDVPGRSWLTVDLNELVSLIETLSLTITADQGVVIPSMVVASDVDEASWPGTGLATTWEFPAARQTGLTPRVVVSNPGTAPVDVEVDVYSEDEWVESARAVEVPPATPVSIPVGDLIAGVFGLRVRASDPVSAVVVAEDISTADDGTASSGGGSDDRVAGTVGAPTPQRRWLLPGPGSLPTAASAVWVLNSGPERVTVTLQPLGIDVMEPQKVVVRRQPDRPHRAPPGKRRVRVRGVGAATDLGRVDRRVGERRRLRRRHRRRGVTLRDRRGGHPLDVAWAERARRSRRPAGVDRPGRGGARRGHQDGGPRPATGAEDRPHRARPARRAGAVHLHRLRQLLPRSAPMLAVAGLRPREVTWELEPDTIARAGVTATPLTVVVDGDGAVLDQWSGVPPRWWVSRAAAAARKVSRC